MKWIMVLNDGETYTSLDGSAIVAIPDNIPDHCVDEYVKHSDGWYCFDNEPPKILQSNNNMTQMDLDMLDEEYEGPRY